MKKIMLLAVLSLSTAAFAERFDDKNQPVSFNAITGTYMVVNFDQLPLVGKLNDDRLAWSETYWPSNVGGIAYRWNSKNPQPFKYKFHSKEELKRMNRKQLEELSPAELYDISQGDYQYTLTRKTFSLFTPNDLWWEGICHGWSLAASNYPEPGPVVIVNKDGIKVPFGSSDVKGLLAMHDAYNSQGIYAQVGDRCKADGKVPGEGDSRDPNPNPPTAAEANTPECRDVNAGAFHLVITNMIGIHSKGFIADVDRFNDVWNQPVYAYNAKMVAEEPVSGADRALGIERRVRIALKMSYGEELKFFTPELAAEGKKNFVSKFPVTNSVHQEIRSKDYVYILEMDKDGVIIGGTWISETRPDFIWMKRRDLQFNNYPIPLGGLVNIYRPVKR